MAKRKKKAAKRKAGKRAKRPVSRSKKTAAIKKGGRPRFEPTPEDRRRVELLAGIGMPQEDIRQLVYNDQTGEPIAKETLAQRFKAELARGRPMVHAKVGESLVKRAIDMQHPQGATCAIFLAKTRMGYKETSVLETPDMTGVLYAPPEKTPADWVKDARERNKDAKEPE